MNLGIVEAWSLGQPDAERHLQQGADTVLTGLLDHSALHGALAQIEALGLDLVEVRQFPGGSDALSP